MVMFDLVNASFELAGAFINLLNVMEIRKHKQVKGVHIAPFIFFSVWGFWNILYYGSLEQTFSMLAAVFLAVVNSTWVYYAVKYKKTKEKDKQQNQLTPKYADLTTLHVDKDTAESMKLKVMKWDFQKGKPKNG